MKEIVDIPPAHLTIIKNILDKHLPSSAVVFAFGSRVKGHAKKFSDLDLTVDAGERLSRSIMTNVAFDFEESDLPYKVDFIDWNRISESFKNIIMNDRVVIWKGNGQSSA